MPRRFIILGLLLTFAIGITLFIRSPGNQKTFVTLKGEILDVEVMHTPYGRSKGLSGRQNLPENQGMLFIFSEEEQVSFWMKDTLIPLSIAFIDKNKKITQLEDMQPDTFKEELPRTVAKQKVLYALEVNQGWFQSHGIAIGDHVAFSKPIQRLHIE